MQFFMALAALLGALAAPPGLAQAPYPSRPIRLVVGFPAGGPADIFARTLAQKLSELAGQQIVVDNRAGANGMIAAENVARSAPDGYSVYFSSTGVLALSPHLYSKLPVDPGKDLAPATLVVTVPEVLIVHPSLPVKSARELAALAKARPGQIVYGSTGTGGMPHLATESFRLAAGISILHVPYKGAAPAMTELLGGQVLLSILDVPILLPHVKAGKLRALATASGTRAPTLPDVPTMAEAGYPSVIADNWYGAVVPAATPKDVLIRLHALLVKALQTPDIKERFAANGGAAAPMEIEAFAAFVREETARWGKVIKASGVTLD